MAKINKRFRVIILFILGWFPGEAFCQYLITDHYKSITANEVGKKIAAARGDMRQMPSIAINSLNNPRQLIAQYMAYPQPKIILDEKVYDICAGFGRDSLNALACIIGHEMAHFYENHIWTESFSTMMGLAKDKGAALGEAEKGMLEAKADAFGLFYGFLAGYDTFHALPRTLEAIYKEYRIPEKQPGYPDKTERLRFSNEKIKEIKPLFYAFRSGQLLLLRKEYDLAAICFDFILKHYPGPEIYNNLGVTYLSRCLELMDPTDVYFAYPFELDADTRLKRGILRTGPRPKTEAVHLLSLAQEAFEKAIVMDRTYIPGYVNLACSYSLLDNQPSAIGKINELERIIPDRELSGNAHLIKGIALVKNNQIERAGPEFEKAFRKQAFQYRYNMDLYEALSSSWKDKTLKWITDWPTLENWIREFWNQPKPPSASTSNMDLKRFVSIPTNFGGGDITSVNIMDKQHTMKIAGTQNKEGYSIRLELPDYRLTATFFHPYQQNTNLTMIWKEKIGDPNYILAGSGNRRYEHLGQEKVIFEIENNSITGIWKYEVDF